MTKQGMLDLVESGRVAEEAADGTPLWWKIQALANESDQLLLKKLARNDTSWADDPGKHQAGLYIPVELKDSGFFPPFEANNPEKPHIFVASMDVLWPQTAEVTRSNIRHYSNKGAEAHLTRLPKDLFRQLTPASLFLAGRLTRPTAGCDWWAVVLDSAGDEAELMETLLDLPVDFRHGLFPADSFGAGRRAEQDELEDLIEQFRAAIRNGTLHELVARYSVIPDPAAIATEARSQWLHANGRDTFDPWQISAPGDAIMKISREIEYRLYRAHELKRRASELLAILVDGGDLASTVVRKYPDIDAILLSASQQRKTRAGRSFEHHIAASLTAGGIHFQEQAVTGGRRPDFVLPDVVTLRRKDRTRSDALVLAAKTTLRERWKQVSNEQLDCDVFLATVDDRVSPVAIHEMAGLGIRLVVPELLKRSDEAFYKGQENVLSFREFFDHSIRAERPALLGRMKH